MQWLNKRLIGNDYEKAAEQYLTKQGLIYQARNFNCKCGEIDLIFMDQQTLVFVEVRFRANQNFGSAADTIGVSKQKKVKNAALFYMQQKNINVNHCAIRFDVVTFDGKITQVNWIKNAF